MKRPALFTIGGMTLAGSAAAVALLSAGAFVATPGTALAKAKAPSGDCAAMATPGRFAQTKVTSAKWIAADSAKGVPAYCEVTAVVSPVPTSKIGVVYRLPAGWNGKMLGLGGGGWAGNVRIEGALPGLKRGYATAQTDGGHESTSPWDTAWTSNPESISDFSYRAIHLMTSTGKTVVKSYYGKGQSEAYYQGCSTGGRQGLMEVQRFPNDYDGVIAGAPVYNLLVQTSAVIRNQIFGAPGAGFTADQFKMVKDAVLKACDAKDGLVDGLINDPRACSWDPAEIQCKASAPGAQCLSEAQVTALRAAYSGVQEIDGRQAAWPLARGGEPGWSRFIQTSAGAQDATNGGGFGGLRGPLLGDPNFDMSKFDHTVHLATVRSSAFARAYEANDPAIGAFASHGKLLMWHGWSDPGPSPIGTITYYRNVTGAVPQAQSNVRLFMAPGVYHCGGGPGPDQIDLLTALDRWVKTGKAPETLLATKADSKMSRPLCAYPKVAHYKGAGDPDVAENSECR